MNLVGHSIQLALFAAGALVAVAADAAPVGTSAMTLDKAPQRIQRLLTRVAREAIPDDYADTKKWGGQKEIFAGLSIRREGWRLKTKRKRRKVNHGTWRRYRIRLVQPHQNLTIRLLNLVDAGNGKLAGDLVLRARLDAGARIAEWNRGVQLVSLSASGQADVEVRLKCQMGLTVDPSHLPPDVILQPRVTDADIQLRSFRLRQISKVRGVMAREIGDMLRNYVANRINEKEPTLVRKINRQLARHHDDLRLSARELWQQRAGPPAGVE